MKRLSWLCLAICIVGVVVGCKPPRPKAPSTAAVKGTVTLDGAPMGGGHVRFNVAGQGPMSCEVKDGAFSGEAYIGKNRVDVTWDKEGEPVPGMPDVKMTVNAVAAEFSGPGSPFNFDVPASGKSDFKLAVTSAR